MWWEIRYLGAVLACCFAVCACEPKSESLPPGMLGVWRSEEPRYRDRYFELRDESVIFGTGVLQFDMHALEHVASEANANGDRRYTIRYRTKDGETAAVQVIHHPGPQATLRFANHDEVWTPSSTSLEGG